MIMWVVGVFLGLYHLWIWFAVHMMYLQEKKAYKNVSYYRAAVFSLKWIYGSFVCCILVLPVMIREMSFSNTKVRNAALYRGQQLGLWMFKSIFGQPQVAGKENLPKDQDTAVIFAVNHQSMIDIALLYFVEHRFAWVSKSAAFSLPGIGSLMSLSQFIRIIRGDKKSAVNMFQGCVKTMASNASVAIFPQGTRDRRSVRPFKHGAFSLAADHGYTIVPCTLYLPEDIWSRPNGAACRLTIHPPIPPSADKEALRRKCAEVVLGALPEGYAPPFEEEEQPPSGGSPPAAMAPRNHVGGKKRD